MESYNRPKSLSLSGNVSDNWRRFKQQFEIYLTASDKAEVDDDVKVALLLNFAGEEALEVFNTFTFATPGDAKKLAVVFEKFNTYCNPRKNVVYERYNFWKCTQQEENIDSFVTILRQKIKACEYPSNITDDMIRDKLVFGIKDLTVKERLLREESLTLQKALDIARASEVSKMQIKEMNEQSMHHVNAIAKNKGNGPKSVTNCRYCGSSHAPRACPAYGKECGFCHCKNHFEHVCRKKKYSQPGKKDIHTIAEQQHEAKTDEELLIYSIDSKNTGKWVVDLRIGSRVLRCKIDTGADCSVISMKTLQSVVNASSIRLTRTKSKLRVYDGSRVSVLGTITLQVEYKNTYKLITFNVVDQDLPSVLGIPGIEELGLLQRVFTLETEANTNADIMEEFKDVFSGLGTLKDVKHTIQLKENARPVIQPPRRVPVAIRQPLKDELDRMVHLDVIEKVNGPTDWVNSLVIVMKKNKKLRVCLDPSDLNKAIRREHYPMKTVEDVVSRMPKAQYFTVLDANHGYWQVPLCSESSKLCTFNTPFGRYAFKRLPFGVCSASEVFQREMENIVEDLEGVEVIVDDLLIWASTKEEHDKRLRAVLQRARERGLRLNPEKSQVCRSSVTYVGHTLCKDGLTPDPKKIEAVQQMNYPKSKEELQRYLGIITYLAKFIPSLSQRAEPLRLLLEKDVMWHWGEEQSKAYDSLKASITAEPVLAYFDVNKNVTLSVDASSKGLGAVILQDTRPVAYASRAMTKSEENYAQIEKEMLAISYGCERFHDYLYGQKQVHVETDHKPLEAIFKKPIHKAPTRLQRMLLRIQPYNLQVKYKKGSQLYIADALSRHYLPNTSVTDDDEFEVHIIESGQVSVNAFKEILTETKADEELQELHKTVMTGWPNSKDEVKNNILPYWNYRDEITVKDGLLMKLDRVIIPRSMRKSMLQKIHIAHFGIEKCKNRARSAVYWPGINNQIKDMIEQCGPCQRYQRSQQKETLMPLDVPERPWQCISADYFYYNGSDYLLLVDNYSKWPEVIQVREKTAEATIQAMKEVFARAGIPEEIISDNMPFNSIKVNQFASQWGIKMSPSSPRYAKSHGQVERFVDILRQMIRKTSMAGEDYYMALLELRNTPITGTNFSPAELLMSRRLRSILPVVKSQLMPRVAEGAREQLLEGKLNMKFFHDRSAKDLPPLNSGDTCRIRVGKTWEPAVVKEEHEKPRSYNVTTGDGREYRRNRSHLRFSKEQPPSIVPLQDSGLPDRPDTKVREIEPTTVCSDQLNTATHETACASPAQTQASSVYRTKSGRISAPPDRLTY